MRRCSITLIFPGFGVLRGVDPTRRVRRCRQLTISKLGMFSRDYRVFSKNTDYPIVALTARGNYLSKWIMSH